ncbi:MAG: ATP-dependent Clp protease ATP-binding subunit [Thermodesulfobacteriota bacterium]
MPERSAGLGLGWMLAAIEAGLAGHLLIEPEYLFIGLCKLEDVATLSRLRRLQVDEADLPAAKAEVDALLELFSRFNLDPRSLRREMRSAFARGPRRKEDEVPGTMHRSARSRAVFARAGFLAQGANAAKVTLFHLLAALLEDPSNEAIPLLRVHKIEVDGLRDAALRFEPAPMAARQGGTDVIPPEADSVLARYGKDLCEEARAGKIHAAIGRKDEMLAVARTLSRATKNNPLLLGEPGVGKTAVVEGLAWRIGQGNVPTALRGKRIVQVHVADLVAGTKYRGEFEDRLQRLVREVSAAADVILFLDEVHTLVGAGKAEGAMDAASILKPALARGELRCIGATTLAEYRRHMEKDPALERRFQPITIHEPTPDTTIEILRQGFKSRLEEKHRVSIGEETLAAASRLSARYLPDRRLPDKAIDLLDEACARVQITRLSITPRRPDLDEGERDRAGGVVTPGAVAEVLAEWTGIPAAQLSADERERLLRMAEALKDRVIGQDEAADAVSEVVQRARAGLKAVGRPIGVLLFLGPTGVGKTELAKATADFLFGSDRAMIRLDMSEFAEKHHTARLVGSPPGYVGSEEEGQLTGALRRKPFSVVLLDEIEKAHPDVLDLFLQAFDDGRLSDAKGRLVDASNTLFILTSNLVPARESSRRLGFRPQETKVDREDFMSGIRKVLPPEFLNRIDRAVVFHPLDPEHMTRIAKGMLAHLGNRMAEQGIGFHVTEAALSLLARLGYDPAYGARPLRRIIEQHVGNPLSAMLLRGEVRPGQEIVVDARAGEITLERLDAEGGRI